MITASAGRHVAPRLRPRLTASDVELISKTRCVIGFDDLSDVLELPPRFLRAVLYGLRERKRYRTFDIPKRGGGTRTIHAPPKNLKILQEKLNRILSLLYRPKPCVHGFCSNRSVRSNADRHHGQKWVLNIDLVDFFGHITLGRIAGALREQPFGFPKTVASVIAQIACLDDGRLPQGSPCSPVVSNVVAHGLDVALLDLARRHHCVYTRYADDISFSTSKTLFPGELARHANGDTEVGDKLNAAVVAAGFKINRQKVRLQSRMQRQDVTGLTVNEFPNVRRSFVREVRAILHAWDRHGLHAAQRELNKRLGIDNQDAATLARHVRGKLAYLQMVRGRDDPVFRKLLKKLHALAPTLVSAWPDIAQLSPSRLRGHLSGLVPWENVLRRVRDGVFFLEVDVVTGDKAAGTAFKVADDLLGTAGHNLIHGAVRAGLSEEVPLKVDRCTNLRHGIDVGLLRSADGKGISGRTLLSQSRLPEIGEQVAAVGFPSQPFRHPTLALNVGIVESLPVSYHGCRFIQVSFQSSGGLSGAPLIDRGGYVVGIIVEATSNPIQEGQPPPRAFAQAIPIEYLHDLRRQPESSSTCAFPSKE